MESSIEARVAVHVALGDVNRLRIVDALSLGDRNPTELAQLLGIAPNLISHHLRVLSEAGVVERAASSGDGRRAYVTLVLDPDLPTAQGETIRASSVLFVCAANSARSQLAAAIWNNASSVPAASAGSHPADDIHPGAVAAAARHGLELDDGRPRGYGDVATTPDVVISVCDRAREGTWPFAGSIHLHWSVPDPVGPGRAEDFEAAFGAIAGRIARVAPCIEAAA